MCYGDLPSNVFSVGKDFKVLSYFFVLEEGYFKDRFFIFNDFNTPFWEVSWLEGISLKDDFSDLYKASCLKNVSVEAMGGWLEGVWQCGYFDFPEAYLEDTIFLENAGLLKGRLEVFDGWLEGKDFEV